MRQILQHLRSGEMELAEVPCPQAGRGQILIQTRASLISPGTERMLIEFSQANLIQKARQQPEKVQQVLEKLNERVDQVELMLDACHEYLLDPEDPTRYYLGPRADEVEVIYLEKHESGRVYKRRARLSQLLDKTGKLEVGTDWRHADPRKLLLEVARTLEGILMTLSKIAGYVRPPEHKTFNMTQINIYELKGSLRSSSSDSSQASMSAFPT